MASSTDYTGRTIDLLTHQGITETGSQLVSLALYSVEAPGGQVITGIQKVVQTFLQLFLTDLGSVPSAPELGTGFYGAVRRGEVHTQLDVRTQFGAAAETVRRHLAPVETALPDDERFASAVLDNFNLDQAASKLVLTITVRSRAGEARTVYLPVSLAIK